MRQLRLFLVPHSFLLFAISFKSVSKAWAAGEIPNIIKLPEAPPLLEKKEIAPAPPGEKVYAETVSSVILISCNTSDGKIYGAGSIITTDGFVLTNFHVIEKATACFGTLKPPGKNSIDSVPSYPLKIIASDRTKDLALVQFQPPILGLKPIPIGQMSSIKPGQEVHAIGHPLKNYWAYTKGPISRVSLQDKFMSPIVADLIQTQTPISSGSSGGPLLDNEGYLIGVNTASRTDGQNINYAVAVSEVRDFIDRSNKEEKSTPPTPVNTEPSNQEKSCEPRVIREEDSKKTPGKVRRLDLGCTGKENAAMLTPNDPSQEIILYISTKPPADGEKIYFDRRYYIDQKTEKFLRSWHDVDRDGRPDYVGIHKTGSIEPTSYFFFNTLSAE